MSWLADAETMRPLGWALVHFLWQGALIAGAVALISLVIKKASARYLLFCGALALMAISPALTAIFLAREPAGTPVAVPFEMYSAAGREPWLPWIMGLWIAGVSVCILRLIGGCIQVQKLRYMAAQRVPDEWTDCVLELSRRIGVRQHVQLLIVDRIDVPATIGTLRALILMPACAITRLSKEQLEALIAHELAHISRYDYLVNLVQSLVEAVLFYHPAIWWVSKQIRNEREHCCDDIAVATVGDTLTYARALERLETLRAGNLPGLAMAVNGGSVCDRIKRLVGIPTASNQRILATPFVALVLGIAALVGVSAKAAVAQSEQVAQNPVPTKILEPFRTFVVDLNDVRTGTALPRAGTTALRIEAPRSWKAVNLVVTETPRKLSISKRATAETTAAIPEMRPTSATELPVNPDREVERLLALQMKDLEAAEKEIEGQRNVLVYTGTWTSAIPGEKTTVVTSRSMVSPAVPGSIVRTGGQGSHFERFDPPSEARMMYFHGKDLKGQMSVAAQGVYTGGEPGKPAPQVMIGKMVPPTKGVEQKFFFKGGVPAGSIEFKKGFDIAKSAQIADTMKRLADEEAIKVWTEYEKGRRNEMNFDDMKRLQIAFESVSKVSPGFKSKYEVERLLLPAVGVTQPSLVRPLKKIEPEKADTALTTTQGKG